MRAVGREIFAKVMECKSGLMELVIKEIGLETKPMEKESLST